MEIIIEDFLEYNEIEDIDIDNIRSEVDDIILENPPTIEYIEKTIDIDILSREGRWHIYLLWKSLTYHKMNFVNAESFSHIATKWITNIFETSQTSKYIKEDKIDKVVYDALITQRPKREIDRTRLILDLLTKLYTEDMDKYEYKIFRYNFMIDEITSKMFKDYMLKTNLKRPQLINEKLKTYNGENTGYYKMKEYKRKEYISVLLPLSVNEKFKKVTGQSPTEKLYNLLYP